MGDFLIFFARLETVRGIELVLEDVIMALLNIGLISCSRKDVSRMIEEGRWCEFDESFVMERIRELARDSTDEKIKLKAEAILKRLPPKLVWEEEFLAIRYERKTKELFLHLAQRARDKKFRWAERFGIEPERWYIWPKNVEITKVGSLVDVASYFEAETDDQDKYSQAIRVLKTENPAVSVPIMKMSRSLMHILANYSIYILRIYVLLRPDEVGKKEEIRAAIQNSLSFAKE